MPDTRSWRPHLTIGRRARKRPPDEERSREQTKWKAFAFTPPSIAVFASHPGPEGSRYEVVARFPLPD